MVLLHYFTNTYDKMAYRLNFFRIKPTWDTHTVIFLLLNSIYVTFKTFYALKRPHCSRGETQAQWPGWDLVKLC